jgi:hypothetical protein
MSIVLDPDFAQALKDAVVVPEKDPLTAALPKAVFSSMCKGFATLAAEAPDQALAMLVLACELAEKGMQAFALQCRTMVKAALDAGTFEHMLGQAENIHKSRMNVAETKKAAIDKPRVALGMSLQKKR